MNNAQLINQDSGNVEYYTPWNIIEAARRTMGSIDLDPASSREANKIVKAESYFDKSEDGLKQTWFGNVWMNHPFGRKNNVVWIQKLINEFNGPSVDQACCITFASTSEKWFWPLLDYPQCFLYSRTNYILPNGDIKKGATKGSVVTYLGDRVEDFKREFEQLGKVKI